MLTELDCVRKIEAVKDHVFIFLHRSLTSGIKTTPYIDNNRIDMRLHKIQNFLIEKPTADGTPYFAHLRIIKFGVVILNLLNEFLRNRVFNHCLRFASALFCPHI